MTSGDTELLIDTDVFSYLAWNRPQGGAFARIVNARLLAVSFVTVGELCYGAVKAGWGETRVGKLEGILNRYTVIPGTEVVAATFGNVKGYFRDQMDDADMWIAATAIAHELPVVTNNLRHFRPMAGRFGFRVVHPDNLET